MANLPFTPGPTVTDLSPNDPFRDPAAAAAELERLAAAIRRNNPNLTAAQALRVAKDRHPELLARTHAPAPQNPPVGVRTPEAVPAGSRAHIEQAVNDLAQQYVEQFGGTHAQAVVRIFSEQRGLLDAYEQAPRTFTTPEPPAPTARHQDRAMNTVEEHARAFMEQRPGVTRSQALDAVMHRDPALYQMVEQARRRDRNGEPVSTPAPTPPRMFAEPPREGFNTRVAQAFAELPDGARRQLARAVGAATAVRHPEFSDDQVLEATGDRLAKWGLLR